MQHQALETLEGTPMGGSFAFVPPMVVDVVDVSVVIDALGLIGLIGLISPGCGQPS